MEMPAEEQHMFFLGKGYKIFGGLSGMIIEDCITFYLRYRKLYSR